MFETVQDGAIEWYEFLDFLLVLRFVPRPLTRTSVETAMKGIEGNTETGDPSPVVV
jgi:hypothetical protein